MQRLRRAFSTISVKLLLSHMSKEDLWVGVHYFIYPTLFLIVCSAYDVWNNYHHYYNAHSKLIHIPVTLFYSHKNSLILLGHILFFAYIPFIYRRLITLKSHKNLPNITAGMTRSYIKLFFYFFLCPAFVFIALFIPYTFLTSMYIVSPNLSAILKIIFFTLTIPILFYHFHARLYAVLPGHFSSPYVGRNHATCYFKRHPFAIFVILICPFALTILALLFTSTFNLFFMHTTLNFQHFHYLSMSVPFTIMMYASNLAMPVISFATWIIYIILSVNIFIHQKNCAQHADRIS